MKVKINSKTIGKVINGDKITVYENKEVGEQGIDLESNNLETSGLKKTYCDEEISINALKLKISKREFKDFFTHISKFKLSKEKENLALVFFGRYNSLEEDYGKGLISNDDYETRVVKLSIGILEYLDNLL